MSYGWWFLVIFLTAFAVIYGFGVLLKHGQARYDRIMLLDELDQAVSMPQLPIAGYFDLPGTLARFAAPDDPYGPFPVDTGPLLILSDKTAANVALEREIRQRCDEAEAKIPPRWR